MNNLELISTAENLRAAFKNAQHGCNWKNSVQLYEADLDINTMLLQDELRSREYRQGTFFEFDLSERGKHRHIKALKVRDRVVQRSLCDSVLVPQLRPYTIYDNGASLKGKGISFSRARMMCHLERYIRRYGADGYILQMDFSNFFGSIPHRLCIDAIMNHLQDDSLFWLIDHLVRSFDPSGIGLGIGSQISQVCGIIYPAPIDNLCKIVLGCKAYGRYMDDMYVLHSDKEFLKYVLTAVGEQANDLGLTLHPNKSKIVKLSHGFTFLKTKYNITETGHIIRRMSRTNVTRERVKLKKYRALVDQGRMPLLDAVNCYFSWRGNAVKYDSFRTLANMDELFISLFGEQIEKEKITWRRSRSTKLITTQIM